MVVWEVVANTDCGMWSHRDGFPGVVWSGLVWWSCGVRRWGGCGCGGLIGRVVWAAGWFLPAVPHPVVVWEVVANKDCGMWSHRDGFPGVVWSGLVWRTRPYVQVTNAWYDMRANLLGGYTSDETANRGAEPRNGYECLYGSTTLRQLRR